MSKRHLEAPARLAAALLVTALSLGCGAGAQVDAANKKIASLQGQLRSARKDNARIARKINALERRIKALEGRLRPHRQRAGELPFRGGTLKRSDHGDVRYANGKRVARAGQRGKKAHLGKHLDGRRGAVLGFWATWCKPCISDPELVHLKHLQKQLRPYDVELVSVLIDDLDKALSHAKAPRWLYPLWFVRDGHMEMLPRKLVQKVGLGLPLFVIVGPDGELRWHHQGKLTDAAVRDIVTAAARL